MTKNQIGEERVYDAGFTSVCCEYCWLTIKLLGPIAARDKARWELQADKGGVSRQSHGEAV